MNEQDNDHADDNYRLTTRASELFDESVQSLDAQTRSRLNRSRQLALADIQSGRGFKTLSPWVPVAGFATATAFAVLLWSGQAPPIDTAPMAATPDFEILLNDDSIEMLQDLEFYSWIDMDAEMELSEDSNVG